MKRIKTQHPGIITINGVFYVRQNGVDISLRTRDEGEALEKAQYEKAKLDSTGVKARLFKVTNLYNDYLKDCEKQLNSKLSGRKKLRQGSYDEIRYLFGKHLIPFFGKKRLAEIDHRLWAKYCKKATVSDLANHRKVMARFLKWCKREGYINALPDISDIPYHKRRKRRIIRPDEIKTIFSFARGNLLLFLSMALFMGMRRKEIMALSWGAIDFIERYLVLQDEDVKTDEGREVTINTHVLALLAQAHERARLAGCKSPYVFPNRRDPKRHMSVSGLKTAWQNCLTKTGLADITWHDFRATFEKYSHKSTEHTDTQREKFVGASIDVQRKRYVSMTAEDVRGLEEVVKVQGLEEILIQKLAPLDIRGKDRKF